MPVGMSKVLIIEDDEVLGQGMASHLSLAGFDPLLVEKGDTGLGFPACPLLREVTRLRAR